MLFLKFLQHFSKVPELDDVITAAGFTIQVPEDSEDKKKRWYVVKKEPPTMFIRMNQTFLVRMQYCAQPGVQYYLRLMAVFTAIAETSRPVERCSNHKSLSKEGDPQALYVVQCNNANIEYMGKADGKNFGDRLSMRIPLMSTGAAIESDIVELSISCHNSCAHGLNRRQTAVLFILEDKV